MSDRLNQQQVDRQIADSFTKFYQTVYTRPLPSNFISLFAEAIFFNDPNKHQIHVKTIRHILSKKVIDLTTIEVGGMVNVINGTPFNFLYPDLESALNGHEVIEQLTINYNDDVNTFKIAMDAKRKTLMQLVQGTGRGNAMKIIKTSDA